MVKLDFPKEAWEEFLQKIDFKDDEKHIIELKRRGFCEIDIAAELLIGTATVTRKISKINTKIMNYLILKFILKK